MVKLCEQCVFYSNEDCIHPSNMQLNIVSDNEEPEFCPSLYRLNILGRVTCGQDGRLFIQRDQ
jgi:hypothetical protein